MKIYGFKNQQKLDMIQKNYISRGIIHKSVKKLHLTKKNFGNLVKRTEFNLVNCQSMALFVTIEDI